MGQQQLLLVILVTIIVGIATVVAINVFGTSAENANLDAVRQDLLAAATASQGWYAKPVMLGGGGQSFEDLTLFDLAIPYDSRDALNTEILIANANGSYAMVAPGAAAQTFTITATPTTWDGTVTLVVDEAATTPATRIVITPIPTP